MDTKEEKKERKQSYFARLKKKKQAKQNAETASAVATRTHTGKEDNNTVVLEPDKCNIAVEEEYMTDEKKKRKSNQLKEIRRTELKRYYSIGLLALPASDLACFSVPSQGDVLYR